MKRLIAYILMCGASIFLVGADGCGDDEVPIGDSQLERDEKQLCQVFIRVTRGSSATRIGPAPGDCAGSPFRVGEQLSISSESTIAGLEVAVTGPNELTVTASSSMESKTYEISLDRSPADSTTYIVSVYNAEADTHKVTLHRRGYNPLPVRVRDELCLEETCEYEVERNADIVYQIQGSQAGRSFPVWEGDCTATMDDEFALTRDVLSDIECTVTWTEPELPFVNITVEGPFYGQVRALPNVGAEETCPRPRSDDPSCKFFGDSIRLVAEPRATGEFVSWGGDCQGQSGPTITLDAASEPQPFTNWNCTVQFQEKPLDCTTIGEATFTLKPSSSGTSFGTSHFTLPYDIGRLYFDARGTQFGDNERLNLIVVAEGREIFNDEVRKAQFLSNRANPVNWIDEGGGTMELSVTDSCGTRTATATFSISQ